MKTTEIASEDFKCPEDKCALSLIYPKSNASIACDLDCYFCKDGEGFKKKAFYFIKHKEIFKEL